MGTVGRSPGGESEVRRRIEGSPGIAAAEAHAFAGLADAEGHFALRESNGGSTWTCNFSIALREDDAAVLVALRDGLGLGRLVRVAARASSRAQVEWIIGSKLECLVLAEILSDFPLRGRKQREFEVWREAVRLWTATRRVADPQVWRRMAELGSRILLLRKYGELPASAAEVCSDRALIDFFGGFFSGDGCFSLPKNGGARLAIKLRRDDRPLLDMLAASFEIGSVVNTKACGTSSPTAVWTVRSSPDLLKAVALLDSAPLLGRKADQYICWRAGALEVVRAWLEGRKANPVVLEMARCGLTAGKAFVPMPRELLPSEDRNAVGRRVYVDVLQKWAAGCNDRLTRTRYTRDRGGHPGWPDRNTITRTFGSWSAALHAAGLDG